MDTVKKGRLPTFDKTFQRPKRYDLRIKSKNANKYSKIIGDVSIIYLMLNFGNEKRMFCLDEIVSRYNFNKKGVWSSLSKKEREKSNKYYFLNLIRMVSLKYKILIILKKLNIINAKKN